MMLTLPVVAQQLTLVHSLMKTLWCFPALATVGLLAVSSCGGVAFSIYRMPRHQVWWGWAAIVSGLAVAVIFCGGKPQPLSLWMPFIILLVGFVSAGLMLLFDKKIAHYRSELLRYAPKGKADGYPQGAVRLLEPPAFTQLKSFLERPSGK
jgi:hypothetical protein